MSLTHWHSPWGGERPGGSNKPSSHHLQHLDAASPEAPPGWLAAARLASLQLRLVCWERFPSPGLQRPLQSLTRNRSGRMALYPHAPMSQLCAHVRLACVGAHLPLAWVGAFSKNSSHRIPQERRLSPKRC